MKLPISVVLAIALNMLLVIFIHWIISADHNGFKSADQIQMVDFIRLQEDQKIIEPDKPEELPDEPLPPEEPPPPPEMASIEPEKPVLEQEFEMPAPKMIHSLQLSGGPYLGGFKQGKQAPPPPPPKPKPRPISGLAVPTYRVPPTYPARAMRAGLEGIVTVEFTITTEGKVAEPKILKAVPPMIFNKSVLKAIKKWKFEVRKVDGKAVSRRASQDIKFSLDKKRR